MAGGRKILLAVRIGEASAEPGRTAAWLGKELDARITVLYVAIELQTAAEVATSGGLDEAAVRENMVASARERATALGRDVLGDVPFDVMVVEGDVAEQVAEAAARIGADLVVAGSRGRGAIQSVILGDTTRDILRRSQCPVVVVPPGATNR